MTGHETANARVIGRVASDVRGAAQWALECVCGTVFRAAGQDIRRRPSMSCGCRGKRPALKRVHAPGLCRCCDNRASSRCRGLCARCYGRAAYRGVLDDVALPPLPNGQVGAFGSAHPTFKGTQTDDERAYSRIHKSLRRKHGPAKNRLCSEGCGQQAAHWSYDGHCPGERFGGRTGTTKPYCPHLHHYQPRCRSCHWHWDDCSDSVAQMLEVA